MSGGEGSVRSPLDKPLGELTEEDIAQLTREDCRRFLKEKGMRRPSWNKSQAIQQVVSLKALLESPESAGDGVRVKTGNIPPTPPVTSPQGWDPSPRKEEQSVSESAYRRRDPNANPNPNPGPNLVGAVTCGSRGVNAVEVGGTEKRCPSPRVAAAVPAAQMTIFYDGKVNVYNGVTPDKARAIMQVAAAPDSDLFDPTSGPVQSIRSVPFRASPPDLASGPVCAGFPTSPPGKSGPVCRETAEWGLARENEHEGPTGRQASLQRYLEKRKDRYKGKRIIGGSSLSSMEMMYLSQKFRGQTPNEQSSPSNASSPTQPRPPRTPTRCSSIENQAQNIRISIDLNDEAGGT